MELRPQIYKSNWQTLLSLINHAKSKHLKYFSFVALLLISISCKQKAYHLQRIEAKRIAVTESLEKNKQVTQFISPYIKQLDEKMNHVLAYSPTELIKNREKSETNIGNFMADLCYKRGNSFFKKRTVKNVDFVLLNYGGIRAGIPKGNVTTRNAYEVMPFENNMVVVELSHEKLQEMFDYLAKSGSAHPISKHLHLVFENEKVNRSQLKNKKIDKENTYYVLTSDYLQNGGDRMYFFKNPLSMEILDYKIRTAILDELEEIDTIHAKIDGRVIRKLEAPKFD
jgi:5'-nucleotidase